MSRFEALALGWGLFAALLLAGLGLQWLARRWSRRRVAALLARLVTDEEEL